MHAPTTQPAAGQRRSRDDGYGRSSRFYEIGGESFPSVTTILGVLGKPALVNWAANKEREACIEAACAIYADLPTDAPKMMPAVYKLSLQERIGKQKAHARELIKASEIGTEVHALIEWSMKREMGRPAGRAPKVTVAASDSFARYEEWRLDVALRPRWIEATVFSERHRYAGTVDCLGDIEREAQRLAALLDWKTGKAIYAEALLQNSAYVEATREMGTGVDVGGIVRFPKVSGEADFEVRWIGPEEHARLFQVFLNVKAIWDWMEESKTVVAVVG